MSPGGKLNYFTQSFSWYQARASVHKREVVRLWDGPLCEIALLIVLQASSITQSVNGRTSLFH